MQLEGYSDLSKLTRGGMATVYKARQDSLDRTVAIKFLSAEFLWDDQAKGFFDQESLVIARLNHPNIIHIIDRGVTAKGRPYFVMDYIRGKELSEIRKQKKLSLNAWLLLLLQTCKGMAFAHKNGVVHRDIKPANILIDGEGHVFILDFGIAWLEASGKPQGEEIVGTPDYMSPEQFSAPEKVSHLSDIYSLGSVMYELFTGKLPAEQFDNLAGSMDSLPPALSDLIIQCLSSQPENRPSSADEVSFSLLKILNGAHLKQSDKEEAKAAIGKASEKFLLLDVLSRNKFSAVYLFEDKNRKKLIVVKKRVRSHAGFEQADKLKNIQHKNLIRILGTSKNSNAFIVVMEYLTGGSLQDRLSRPYSLGKFLDVAIQLCNAMQTAHGKNIIHGDLRPSNILFTDNEQLKVADFGFERHYNDQLDKNWYQPENKDLPSVQRDIFSAGIVFYQMLLGAPPKIKYGQLKTTKDFEELDEQVQQLLKNMIEMQSITRVKSFQQMIPELNKIQQEVNIGKVGLKKPRLKLRYLFLLLIVINLAGLCVFYFINTDFNQLINSLLN